MTDLAFVCGNQQEYMIGAKRTAKAFRKALWFLIQDGDSQYRELFSIGFQHQIRRQIRRLSEAYVLLNSIGHAWNNAIAPEKIDSFFLFHEALNLLSVSCKNLQIGATLAAYAIQRQALEIAAVANRIAIDVSEWKRFKNAKKYDSTKSITHAKNIIPLVGKLNGKLSNQAVHVTSGHIGKSIIHNLSKQGVRVAIGSHFHPSNADATCDAMIDLLEVSCIIEGLAEHSFRDYSGINKYWNKGEDNSGSSFVWQPIGTAKEDFDYIANERKKNESPLQHLHPKVKENERKAFEEIFSDCTIDDLGDLAALEQVLKKIPTSEIVYYFVGLYHEKHGDTAQAITWYDKATKTKNIFDALQRISELYLELGEIEKCIETYWRLITLEPNNGAAHNNFGKLLDELGFLEDALKILERAIELDPQNEIRLYNYANALLHSKKYDDAIAIYEKVAELNKFDPKPWYSRGVALINLGKLEGAYRSFRKAVLVDTGHIASWLNLGTVSQLRGQFKKAKTLFSYCTKLDPKNYVANRALAFVCAELGETEEALRYAECVVAANLQDSGVRDLLKNLGRPKNMK